MELVCSTPLRLLTKNKIPYQHFIFGMETYIFSLFQSWNDILMNNGFVLFFYQLKLKRITSRY